MPPCTNTDPIGSSGGVASADRTDEMGGSGGGISDGKNPGRKMSGGRGHGGIFDGKGGSDGRTESTSGGFPEKRNNLRNLSILVLGAPTPAKTEIEHRIRALGGCVLSLVDCDKCSHMCLEGDIKHGHSFILHNDEKLSKLLDLETVQSSNEAQVSMKLKAQRRLSFEENEREDMEEIFRKNHQLFVCKLDSSSSMTLHFYTMNMKGRVIVEAVTPGALYHISKSTNSQIKEVIRKTYFLLIHLHRIGVSLKGQFDSSHVILDEAKGEFNARFGNLWPEMLERSNGSSVNLDVQCFKRMIRREVINVRPLPHDINYWLSLVGLKEFEDLLSDHIALKENQEGLDKFFALYDIFDDLKVRKSELCDKIIGDLEEYNGWQKVFTGANGNLYLKQTMDFINLGSTNPTDYPDHAGGLLQLLRNSKHHAGKSLLESFILVVTHEFPNLMYDFQWQMFRRGYK